MKKIKRISLTNLEKRELEKREMNKISGGNGERCCICGYGYYNFYANDKDGLYTPTLIGGFSD